MRKIKLFALLLVLIFLLGCSVAQKSIPTSPQNSDKKVTVTPKVSTSNEISKVTPTPKTSPLPQDAPINTTNTVTAPPASRIVNIKMIEAYPNLTFNQPLEYIHAGDNTNRVFIIEKTGTIKVFQNDPLVKNTQIFLDLTNLVDSSASEKGLLGLAFHPDYKNNGLFYVNYTDRNSTIIARYKVNPTNPNQGLKSSGEILISFAQPYANHKGGKLVFGPDGFLYIGTGDGGSAGDPHKNGQNLKSLLGKILRIDVDKPGNPKRYSIPMDNPFAGNKKGFMEEIYAYGLRNPWKFSFDLERGWLWAADVGQGKVEEIDIIHKGANYGWNIMEGSLCYPSSVNCNEAGLTLPVWEYQHPIGESITGGYVYYGKKIPSLSGAYIYGDYITGKIWGLWLDSNLHADNRTILSTNLSISSFGLDQNNEMYIIDYSGKIYKFIQ